MLYQAKASRGKFGSRRGLQWIVLVIVGLCVGAWIAREPLLQGAADWWIVSDPPTSADAVVILGGGLEIRPFVAADLYRKGLVNRILISDVAEERQVQIGAVPTHTELNRRVLNKLGVPDTAIETFGTANKNTREEAVAVREWVERSHAVIIIIPTEVFSARRVRWIFGRELAGKAVRIEVPSFEPSSYTRSGWWQTEQGIVAFQNEVLKYAYYRLRY